MLVHHSVTRLVHDEDREVVENIFSFGARYQNQEGFSALQTLFDNDFVPVSKIRAPNLPFPASFNELRPFISKCISRVCAGKPVRVVNGDDKNRDDTPEFEQESVWAILVGGAKLSRGYTVEGLTISYYRRPTGAGDTLMQMGRWFGFRRSYIDLVRLFIGSKEPKGRLIIDLYEAFGSVCRDEEALRSELLKYSKEKLLPKQVPPLVRQHLPYLPPTSRNKMFNAIIRSRDFAGEWIEKTAAPTQIKLIKKNQLFAAELFNSCQIKPKYNFHFENMKGENRNFDALIVFSKGKNVNEFLKSYIWSEEKKYLALEIDYIESMLEKNRLDDWTILLPQSTSKRRFNLPNSLLKDLSVVTRSRVSSRRYKVFSEPRHREAAQFMCGVNNDVVHPSKSLTDYRNIEAPVLLLYFVQDDDISNSEVTIGFGIQLPGQKVDNAITWTVKDKTKEDEIVIEE
jgi:hypothetical protein